MFPDISLCDRIFQIQVQTKRQFCSLSAYVVSEELSLLHQTSITNQTCLCCFNYTSLTGLEFLGSLFLPRLSTWLHVLWSIKSRAAWLKVIQSPLFTHTQMHTTAKHIESHKHSHLWMWHVADRHMKGADTVKECWSFDRLCWCFYF